MKYIISLGCIALGAAITIGLWELAGYIWGRLL
jgi:hypothetical protein